MLSKQRDRKKREKNREDREVREEARRSSLVSQVNWSNSRVWLFQGEVGELSKQNPFDSNKENLRDIFADLRGFFSLSLSLSAFAQRPLAALRFNFCTIASLNFFTASTEL